MLLKFITHCVTGNKAIFSTILFFVTTSVTALSSIDHISNNVNLSAAKINQVNSTHLLFAKQPLWFDHIFENSFNVQREDGGDLANINFKKVVKFRRHVNLYDFYSEMEKKDSNLKGYYFVMPSGRHQHQTIHFTTRGIIRKPQNVFFNSMAVNYVDYIPASTLQNETSSLKMKWRDDFALWGLSEDRTSKSFVPDIDYYYCPFICVDNKKTDEDVWNEADAITGGGKWYYQPYFVEFIWENSISYTHKFNSFITAMDETFADFKPWQKLKKDVVFQPLKGAVTFNEMWARISTTPEVLTSTHDATNRKTKLLNEIKNETTPQRRLLRLANFIKKRNDVFIQKYHPIIIRKLRIYGFLDFEKLLTSSGLKVGRTEMINVVNWCLDPKDLLCKSNDFGVVYKGKNKDYVIIEGNDLFEKVVDNLAWLEKYVDKSLQGPEEWSAFFRVLKNFKFSDDLVNKNFKIFQALYANEDFITNRKNKFFGIHNDLMVSDLLHQISKQNFYPLGNQIIMELELKRNVRPFRTLSLEKTIGRYTTTGILSQPSSYFAVVDPSFAVAQHTTPIDNQTYQMFKSHIENKDLTQEQWEKIYHLWINNEENQSHIVSVGGVKMIVVGIGSANDFLLPAPSLLSFSPDSSKSGILFVDKFAMENFKEVAMGINYELYFRMDINEIKAWNDNVQAKSSNAPKTRRRRSTETKPSVPNKPKEPLNAAEEKLVLETFQNNTQSWLPSRAYELISLKDSMGDGSLIMTRFGYVNTVKSALGNITNTLFIAVSIISAFSLMILFKQYMVRKMKETGVCIANGQGRIKGVLKLSSFVIAASALSIVCGYILSIYLQPFVFGYIAKYWYLPAQFETFKLNSLISGLSKFLLAIFPIIFISSFWTLKSNVSTLMNGSNILKNNILTKTLGGAIKGCGSYLRFKMNIIFNSFAQLTILSAASIFLFVFTTFVFSNIGWLDAVLTQEKASKSFVYKLNYISPTEQSGEYLLQSYKDIGRTYIDKRPNNFKYIAEDDLGWLPVPQTDEGVIIAKNIYSYFHLKDVQDEITMPSTVDNSSSNNNQTTSTAMEQIYKFQSLQEMVRKSPVAFKSLLTSDAKENATKKTFITPFNSWAELQESWKKTEVTEILRELQGIRRTGSSDSQTNKIVMCALINEEWAYFQRLFPSLTLERKKCIITSPVNESKEFQITNQFNNLMGRLSSIKNPSFNQMYAKVQAFETELSKYTANDEIDQWLIELTAKITNSQNNFKKLQKQFQFNPEFSDSLFFYFALNHYLLKSKLTVESKETQLEGAELSTNEKKYKYESEPFDAIDEPKHNPWQESVKRKNTNFDIDTGGEKFKKFDWPNYIPSNEEKFLDETHPTSSEYITYDNEPLFKPLLDYYQKLTPLNLCNPTTTVSGKENYPQTWNAANCIGKHSPATTDEANKIHNDFKELTDVSDSNKKYYFPTLSRLYRDNANYWIIGSSDLDLTEKHPTFMKNRVITKFLFNFDVKVNLGAGEISLNLWAHVENFLKKVSPHIRNIFDKNNIRFIRQLINGRYGSYFVNRFMTKHEVENESVIQTHGDGGLFDQKSSFAVKLEDVDPKNKSTMKRGIYYLDPKKTFFVHNRSTITKTETEEEKKRTKNIISLYPRPDFHYFFYAVMNDPAFGELNGPMKITWHNNIYSPDYSNTVGDYFVIDGNWETDSKKHLGLVSQEIPGTEIDYLQTPNGDQTYTLMESVMFDVPMDIMGIKQDQRGSFYQFVSNSKAINDVLYVEKDPFVPTNKDYNPIIINLFAAKKYNLKLGSTIPISVLNHKKRNNADFVKGKITHLTVAGIYDSFYKESFFISQKNANKILGLDENYGYNGILTAERLKPGTGKKIMPSQLANSITLYSALNIYAPHHISQKSYKLNQFLNLDGKTNLTNNKIEDIAKLWLKFPKMHEHLAQTFHLEPQDNDTSSINALKTHLIDSMDGDEGSPFKHIIKTIDNNSVQSYVIFNRIFDLIFSITYLFIGVIFPLLLTSLTVLTSVIVENFKNLLVTLNLLGFSEQENSSTISLFLLIIFVISVSVGIFSSHICLSIYVEQLFTKASLLLPIVLKPHNVFYSAITLLTLFSAVYMRMFMKIKNISLPLAMKAMTE